MRFIRSLELFEGVACLCVASCPLNGISSRGLSTVAEVKCVTPAGMSRSGSRKASSGSFAPACYFKWHLPMSLVCSHMHRPRLEALLGVLRGTPGFGSANAAY